MTLSHTPSSGTSSPMSGFLNPVHDAQYVFRSILEAISHPGRIVELDDLPDAPVPLYPAAAAICLGLVDFETPVWVDNATAASAQAINHLKFHCACPITTIPDEACIALLGDSLESVDLARFNLGSDERPETSTTVIIQVEALDEGPGKRLHGPGIDGSTELSVAGIPDVFWNALKRNHALFPRGVDIILCTHDAIVCLPRTTQVGE